MFADQRQDVREAVSDDELLGKVAFRNQQVQEHDEAIEVAHVGTKCAGVSVFHTERGSWWEVRGGLTFKTRITIGDELENPKKLKMSNRRFEFVHTLLPLYISSP